MIVPQKNIIKAPLEGKTQPVLLPRLVFVGLDASHVAPPVALLS
jgi:hypothetical protein